MSLGTSNRDGGKTSESGHLRALAKLVSGDIIEGLAVSQRAAGANMSVDIAVGDAFVRRSDGSYAHPVFNDAVLNQAITTADGSNPRRDILVLYVDYGQAPSTAVSNNTNGVVKVKMVNGTAAGSPVDPTDSAIQASVGAGNPWTKLARVRVPAGQTSISNALIDDLRVLIYAKTNSVPTAALPDGSVTTVKQADGSTTNRKLNILTDTINLNFATIGNFGTTEIVAHSLTATVPAGCTKLLVVGTIRLQAQDATNKDITARVDIDSSTTTATIAFTSVNTFNSANIALVDELAVTPGSHSFRVLVRASSGSANASNCRIKLIPLYG